MSKRAIFDKKNVLVIGGAGFIGSHLCDELVKTSKVICLDNFITGQEKNIDHLLSDPNFEFINHDITKDLELESLNELQKFKIDFQGVQEIYYLACPMSVSKFGKNQIEVLNSNSTGLKNALDMSVKYNAKFLFFSSSVVYGEQADENKRVDESHVGKIDNLSGRAVYDVGKRFAETMVMSYRREYGIDSKVLRLFRVYGPRMLMDDGQMIPDFINNALSNEDLTVYGDENFASSFCYVSDSVEAAIKMMSTDMSGPINIGSDIRINLTELANMIIQILGADSRINYSKELLFMKPLSLPDLTKAKNELGWLPVVTLNKGLELTIEDLRANVGLKGIG